jgi:hypothetical protein
VTAVILLVLQPRAIRRELQALQILVTRGIQPERLIKFASALEHLSEHDVEDLLASRVPNPETGSSAGSAIDRR